MILIADSGSTKTDWRLVNEKGEIAKYETIGFNPYFIGSAGILNELQKSELTKIKEKVDQVFFYAAGCSTEKNIQEVLNPLTTFFCEAKVEVQHDMLAAARATCGRDSGVVAILGTGSNSCLYDGVEITENVKALGFVLGDNGSGADIGKTFIKAFLGGELPREIEATFIKEYNLSTDDILEATYKQALPNKFLAGFSLFVFKNIEDSFIKELVEQRFQLFFERNICKYSNYQDNTLHLIGSIAFVYQTVFKRVAERYKVKIGKVIKQPIEELVKYHIG
jgi:N-acetylglucosamine kinase-like BadF-type ATPase